MVIRGMTISLPWFAFINVSFALIILLRRVLFNDLTPPWLNEKSLIHSIDISATGILLICSGLLLILGKNITYPGAISCPEPAMVMV